MLVLENIYSIAVMMNGSRACQTQSVQLAVPKFKHALECFEIF